MSALIATIFELTIYKTTIRKTGGTWQLLVYVMRCLWVKCGKTSDFGLLNKSSCLTAALGVTKFTTITAMNWATLCCVA